SVTGAYADHRLRVRRSDVRAILAGLLAEVALARGQGSAAMLASLERLRHRGAHQRWIAAVARDLVAHAGDSLVLTSNAQPREVHALVHLLNAALGNVGKTTWFTESAVFEAGAPSHGLAPLLDALDRKEVDTLVVLDGNPCYTTPADLELPRRMRQARERIYFGLYENETAAEATWFIPAAHWLEQWGVTRAYDGTTSIVQPLLEPLHGGRTASEVLAALAGERTPDAHSLVRELFRAAGSFPDFETAWETALQRGIVEDTTLPVVDVTLDAAALVPMLDALGPPADGLEIGFAIDSRVRDGRFTNNAWLLELPDPITKLTWENAVAVAPSTASRLGVATGDVVELMLRGRAVTVPVVVMPGHAEESVTLSFGYGRTGAEALARGLGTNAYALQSAQAPRFDVGLGVRKMGRSQELAFTQTTSSQGDRDLVRHATTEEYRNEPRFARAEDDEKPKSQLYKLPLAQDARHPSAALGNTKDQWAMSIDLNLCNGCSACVVACQAENNTPIVGKQGVLQSREMHWMRIDRYFEDDDDAQMLVQPMLCQHCESAPCEYVCPVNATVHSPDGLNEQVYNRCVGTRFCSNNCPYKVRRFNWFNYHEQAQRGGTPQVRELRKMVMNPDVTVRARGVMEKCTFCVQRIRENEIQHRIAGGTSKEGEVQTACQHACPTTAIVFGSLTWKNAEVVQRRENERAYGVLSELGTEPRVQYLARLRNVNPELDEK
ncbi:MAG: 4Fe-4S dicluster domain-containing protein, partial [Polyangiales bacterium]